MKSKGYNLLKRLFDLVFSTILLILFIPLFILVGLIILVETGSPIVYTAKRVGKNEKKFELYKFRSLRQDAPTNISSDEIDRTKYVTKFGKIIRRTSIDELPQLINVIKGDMSLIGPRPCFDTEIDLINLRKKSNIFSVKPGISGLAQVEGRDLTAEIILEKVKKDKKYIDNYGLKQDIKIFFKTIYVVLTGKGYKE